MMIYRYLLLSTNPDNTIHRPDFLVHAKRRGLLIPAGSSRAHYYNPHFNDMARSGTHAALLRTCRKVYDEALSVLYGENTFSFDDTDGTEAFMAEGLVSSVHGTSFPHSMILSTANLIYVADEEREISMPMFNFRPSSQGRCIKIKHLALHIGYDDESISASDAATHVPKRDYRKCSSWSKFIHNVGYEIDDERICFTALDTLPLDFRAWGLGRPGKDRVLWVSPPGKHPHLSYAKSV